MTARYTQSEWRGIIDDAERDLPSTFPEHESPTLGTPGFAKCIDHTVLKLDATKEQIDALCEEAKRHGFQVGTGSFQLGCSEGVAFRLHPWAITELILILP